jgi:hypothetical protein
MPLVVAEEMPERRARVPAGNPGLDGVVQRQSPSSESCMMIVAVNVLVTLPIRDSSVGSHAACVAKFEKPAEETHSWQESRYATAMASPGRSCSARAAVSAARTGRPAPAPPPSSSPRVWRLRRAALGATREARGVGPISMSRFSPARRTNLWRNISRHGRDRKRRLLGCSREKLRQWRAKPCSIAA